MLLKLTLVRNNVSLPKSKGRAYFIHFDVDTVKNLSSILVSPCMLATCFWILNDYSILYCRGALMISDDQRKFANLFTILSILMFA